MYGKVLILTILVVITVITASCSNNTAETSISPNEGTSILDVIADLETTADPGETESPKKTGNAGGGGVIQSKTDLTFTEALEWSNVVIIGEYINELLDFEDDGAYCYKFKVIEVLRGEVPEDSAHLVGYYGTAQAIGPDQIYKTDEKAYIEKQQYILVMDRTDSLFYDYPRYTLVGGIYIPLDNISKSTMYGNSVKMEAFANKDANYIKDFIRNMEPPKKERKNYTNATDLPTIIKESDLILELKVTEFMGEGLDREHYYCDVVKFIKGDSYVSPEDRKDIVITVFKGGVEVGKSYVVMVIRGSETGFLYMQSSTMSIIPIDDGKTIAEIYEISER